MPGTAARLQLHAYSCSWYGLYTVKHSNGVGEGRRCLRVALAREAGSFDTVYEVELHTRHNGGQVGTTPQCPSHILQSVHTTVNDCKWSHDLERTCESFAQQVQ